jgi:hypothetical protein
MSIAREFCIPNEVICIAVTSTQTQPAQIETSKLENRLAHL